MRLFRIARILFTLARHRLDGSRPRGERLRLALESLGPIFVKFGQLLSVRPDLIPEDIAQELSRLQDRVPPFPPGEVEAALRAAYGRPHTEVFASIDLTPVASASVAQVHFATLPDGREAAVKILRPGITRTIEKDVALLDDAAWLVERFYADGKRLRPREVVAEFGKTIHDELDLLREAANASQLRRNFAGGQLLVVPEVYWDWCNRDVMVMERIHGIAVNDIESLKKHGIDIPRLARDGVEIFFTQVFRDGFFHADMHPGNILVARDGRYCGVDFGIMGTLAEEDKNFLATIFRAFFHRDYHRVAVAHIDAGWVPRDTRVDEFESAIRSVCEPIFDRPLKEIYFGKLLMRLFEVSRRFRMEIQPQLVLLQKTLLQVEGLGRQLDPDLDLRKHAQPILERWMAQQAGPRALLRQLREEAPLWAKALPQLPRLVHRVLSDDAPQRLERALLKIEAGQRRQNWTLLAIAVVLALLVLGYLRTAAAAPALIESPERASHAQCVETENRNADALREWEVEAMAEANRANSRGSRPWLEAVRRNAEEKAAFDRSFAERARACLAGAYGRQRVKALMVLGDNLSNAYGIKPSEGWVALMQARLAREKRPVHVVNASITGLLTVEARRRLPELLALHRPDVVLLEVGTNDAVHGKPAESAASNLGEMIRLVREAKATPVLVANVISTVKRDLDDSYRTAYPELAAREKVALVPALTEGVTTRLPDRIHPDAQAQEVMLRNVWAVLEPILPATAAGPG